MGARGDDERRPGGPAHRSRRRLSLLIAGVLALAFTLLLGLVEMRWAPLRAVDRGVARSLHEHAVDHSAMVTVVQAVSDLGAPLTWWVVLPAVALYLLARRRPATALFVVVTGAGVGVLTRGVKELVGRARPDLPDPVSEAMGAAFPSGHTTGTAVGVCVLLIVFLPRLGTWWRRAAVVAGALLVVTVGLSRVLLGVHWVSDVVGGWLLAAAWVLVMVAAFGPRSRLPRTGDESVNAA